MKLDAYLYTNPGGRPYNEDNADFRSSGDEGLFLLADGLGGHLGGAHASALVVESLLAAWEATSRELSAPGCRQWLEDAILDANQTLLSAQTQRQNSMKSTLVALALKEGRAAWAHVGDSRLYYLTGGPAAPGHPGPAVLSHRRPSAPGHPGPLRNLQKISGRRDQPGGN